MNLKNRQAKCDDCFRIVESDEGLPYFRYKGEGSAAAMLKCKHCGFTDTAHVDKIRGKSHPDVAKYVCDEFDPAGAHEYDSFYCGCQGWN